MGCYSKFCLQNCIDSNKISSKFKQKYNKYLRSHKFGSRFARKVLSINLMNANEPENAEISLMS